MGQEYTSTRFIVSILPPVPLMFWFRIFLFFSLAAAIVMPAIARAADEPTLEPRSGFSRPAEIQEFIQGMAQRHGFDAEALAKLLATAKRNEATIRFSAPTPPGMTPSWSAYRARFIEPIRIRRGLEFWTDNLPALERAEKQFGVPAEVIAAIIGIETLYGRNTGDFRILDVLMTLAFEDTRRPTFYREELEAFLLWTRDTGLDPGEPRGSYAGAIGLPQFMPSSIRRWAIDFDSSGRVDLRASATDAIGSVASFLAGHGWQRGATAVWAAQLRPDAQLQTLTEGGIEPRFTLAQMAPLGVDSLDPIPADELLALIEFQNGPQPSMYRLAAKNFWVVTRYNRSRYYAMAVLEFAETLRLAREQKLPNGSASKLTTVAGKPPAIKTAGKTGADKTANKKNTKPAAQRVALRSGKARSTDNDRPDRTR